MTLIPKRRCWASVVGGCSEKLTGEHVVGNALFEAEILEVSGVEKIAQSGASKAVGKGNLTAKILCGNHNSALSPLDGEVVALHAAIRKARTQKADQVHRVNGVLLERWSLRLLTNLLASGWAGPEALAPDIGIVRQVFGLAPIVHPSGLYVISDYKGSIPPDSVFYAVLVGRTQPPHVLGIVVSLSGLLYVLSTSKADLQQVLRDNGDFQQFSLDGAKTHYHPTRMQLGDRFAKDPVPSLLLEFAWNS